MPRVSGKKAALIIAKKSEKAQNFLVPINESPPNIVLENQGSSLSNPNIIGDKAPPTRAHEEQKPTADDLTQVG